MCIYIYIYPPKYVYALIERKNLYKYFDTKQVRFFSLSWRVYNFLVDCVSEWDVIYNVYVYLCVCVYKPKKVNLLIIFRNEILKHYKTNRETSFFFFTL